MTRSNSIRLGISLTLLVGALLALRSQLSQIEPREVLAHIRAIPAWRVSAAICVTAANYLQLTLYDVLGLRYVGRDIRYSKLAPASFIAVAFGHNIGPSLLSGGSVRYRFYSEQGLSASEIMRLVGFVSATFFVGYSSLAGVLLSTASHETNLPLPLSLTRAIGTGLLLVGATFLLLALGGLRVIRLGKRSLTYPRPKLALAQLYVAATDWFAMALVLSLLLPDGLADYWRILRTLLVAQIAGMLSQVPGGLGVFESLMVVSLTPGVPLATVLGSLVAYRLLYNVLPFVVAITGLGVHELRRSSSPDDAAARRAR